MPARRNKAHRNTRRIRGTGGVYQRKDGLWVGALHKGYDANGKRHREIVYGRTQKLAEESLLKARNAFLLSGGQALGTSAETVGAYLTRWVAGSIAMNQGSYHFRRVKVELIAKTPLWKIPLRKLGREDVLTMVNTSLPALKAPLVVSTPSWQTRKHCKDVLRAALNELVRAEKLGRNPASDIKPGQILGQTKFRPTVMTVDQVTEFVTASMKCEYFALFIMAILAGLRQGELLGLKWTDLNLLKGTVTVQRQLQRTRGRGLEKAAADAAYLALNGKTRSRRRPAGQPARTVGDHLALVDLKTEGSHRIFALPKRVIDELKTHAAIQQKVQKTKPNWNPDRLVFPSDNGGMLQPTFLVSAHFHPTLLNAHLPISRKGSKGGGFRFHDLRHTAATLMLLQKVPHKVVMYRMGWMTMAMVDRYQHLLPQMDDAAAAELDKLFP